MSEAQQQDGGADNQKVSDSSDNNDNIETKDEQQEVSKNRDTERALKDMHKYKAMMKELQAENQTLKDTRASKENEDLKSSSRWKEVAEKFETENVELKGKLKKNSEAFVLNEKVKALKIEAVKAGLLSEAEGDLDYLDMDSIEVELTSTGRTLVSGAEEVIRDLKKTRPHWFKSDSALQFNAGGANNNVKAQTELTYKEIAKFKFSDPKKHKELTEQWLNKKTKGA